MNLINQAGTQLELTAAEWSEMLHVAVLHGWTPQGTFTPPLDFDRPQQARWEGHYDTPTGQMVIRGDAERLALALESATAPPASFHIATSELVHETIRFLRSGPFLVTGPPPGLEAPPFDHQLLSLHNVLAEEPATVEDKVAPPAKTGAR
ncbi:MAG: hypothetical protein R2729_00580 [Bryobacteraceae bacterium]